MNADYLGVFAKFWEPGAVKTRLAGAVGRDAASALYRSFLECLLRRFARIGDHRELSYWPVERRDAFLQIAGECWHISPQHDGPLGSRMHQFFAQAFRRGARRCVLMGSDSPTVPVGYVQEAFRLLRTHSVVLGPSEDGGYYLVGAASQVPPIFDGIPWSTPTVWEQTVHQLERAGCVYAQLPRWYDVDEIEDLVRLRDELAAQDSEDSPWSDLRSAIERVFASCHSYRRSPRRPR